MSQENSEHVITIRSEEESAESTDVSTFIKIRDFSADTFTPVKIKDLSSSGKKNMGYYGIIALLVLIIILALDIYALLDESLIVIINVMIPIAVSLLSIEKLFALVLHIVLKQFK